MKVLFHVKHAEEPHPLTDAALELGVALSSAQVRALEAFEALLLERAIPAGMVAGTDTGRLRRRHVLDCLRAASVVSPKDLDAYDLGSGAGLPGVVVAIARPDLRITLVESRRRRAAFLELAAEQLHLENVTVAAARLETLIEPVDLCFARALAPLARVWTLAEPLLRRGGRLVYFAGAETPTLLEVDGVGTIEVRNTSVLERAGPLVIMAR